MFVINRAIRGSVALQECQDRLKLKKKENLPLKEIRYETTKCRPANFVQIPRDQEKLCQNSVSPAVFNPDLENRFIDYPSYKRWASESRGSWS